MAARYLLESGSPDGYLLEDGSGVLLLDTTVTFDANTKNTNIILSNGNLTIQGGPFVGQNQAARATVHPFATKSRAELTIGGVANWSSADPLLIGVDDGTNDFTSGFPSPGKDASRPGCQLRFWNTGWEAWYSAGAAGASPTQAATGSDTFAIGDSVAVEIDEGTGAVQFFKISGGVQTSLATVTPVISSWFAWAGMYRDMTLTANFGATAFAGTLSSGYSSYDGTATGSSLVGQSGTVAQGSAAPVTSVALTGQSMSVARGSVTPTASPALTGQAVTGSAGTVVPALSFGLSGQSLTAARGSVTAAPSLALSGQAVSTGQGSSLAASSLALTGLAITVARGTVSVASSNVTAALTGQSLSIAQGSLTGLSAVTLVGQSAGLGQDVLIPGLSLGMTGHAIIASALAVVPSNSQVLTGTSLSISIGIVTAVDSNVTAALTGHDIGITLGTLLAVVIKGPPQLQNLLVSSGNLFDYPASPAGNISSITELSGQIINAPPYPERDLA